MDTLVLADQQKNLHSSILCKHWILSRGLTKKQWLIGWIATVSRKSMLLAHFDDDCAILKDVRARCELFLQPLVQISSCI